MGMHSFLEKAGWYAQMPLLKFELHMSESEYAIIQISFFDV